LSKIQIIRAIVRLSRSRRTLRLFSVESSIAFFFYDVPKVLLLLAGMIFLITFIRSFFSPE